MVECRSLSKTYQIDGALFRALHDVSLQLAESSFNVLVGPSGCGKTTLLRILAGLATPSSGRIIREKPVKIGYVFQEPRLMPWLTVENNVGFALKGQLPRLQYETSVDEALELVGLTQFRNAWPSQLSGGMASRVGLARALVVKPDILLLDEPFCALDAFTRQRLQQELSDIWLAHKTTVVFVTHDVEEAVLLADTIYQMDNGEIRVRHDIDLPRRRDPTDPDFIAYRRSILKGFQPAGMERPRPSPVS